MNILASFHSLLSTIVPFVVLLGVLIFVHELGHFLVARWCGVRVEVFSLGFGKKILKYKKGDTTYALSLFPIGGYVKMFGDQPGEEISDEDKVHSFTHKNVWQRIAVVFAGPLVNFLFAIVLFFGVAIIGEEARTPQLGDVAQGTAAYAAGLRSGDKVLSVNGTDVATWEEMQKALSMKENHDLPVTLIVQKENSTQTQTLNMTAHAVANPNVVSPFPYIAEVDGVTPLAEGTTVGVPATSPLYALGLRTGDTIDTVNGKKVAYWRDLLPLLSSQNAAQPLVLDVLRSEEEDKEPLKMTITLAPTTAIASYSLPSLGLESSELYLEKVVDKTPAQAAGLLKDDRLVSINNVTLTKWEDVINNIKSFDGKNPVSISVLRQGKPLQLQIVPKMTTQMLANGTEDKRYTIGIAPVVNMASPETTIVQTSNPLTALSRGISRTWDMSVMTVLSFVRLFEGRVSPKNIGGVISIGQAASQTFKLGLVPFLQMMALISVNLFVLNLLPVPVLDGGHLLFYFIEAAKGAPVSVKKIALAQQVGLAILMSLMIFALFNDFSRILSP